MPRKHTTESEFIYNDAKISAGKTTRFKGIPSCDIMFLRFNEADDGVTIYMRPDEAMACISALARALWKVVPTPVWRDSQRRKK